MNLILLMNDTIAEGVSNAPSQLPGCKWPYIAIGALIVVGGIAVAIYRRKKNKNIFIEEPIDIEYVPFDVYCNLCKEAAEPFDKISDDVLKTALLLEKIDDNNVAPFLYKRHKDGKITKMRININAFPLNICPEDVQNSINKDDKGPYIIKH